MAFWRQLRYLLWKNFLIRRRQKLWTIIEIVLPLVLFLILVWIRTKNTIDPKPQCHYPAKALPSVGLLPFLQNYICALNNTCEQGEFSDFLAGPANNPNYSILAKAGVVIEGLADTELISELQGGFPSFLGSLEVMAKNPDNLWLVSMALLELRENPITKFGIKMYTELSSIFGGNRTSRNFIKMATCGKFDKDIKGMFQGQSSSKKMSQFAASQRPKKKEPPEIWPPEFYNYTEQCGRFKTEPALDRRCSKWFGSMGLPEMFATPFLKMLRGFILVTPANETQRNLVAKMEEVLQGINWFKRAVLDFNYNAGYFQDALSNSSLPKLIDAVENFADSSLCRNAMVVNCSMVFEMAESARGYLTNSSDPNAPLIMWKKSLESLTTIMECFRTDRFVFIQTEFEMETAAMCLMDENLFYAGLVFDMEKYEKDINGTTLDEDDGFPEPYMEYKIRMPDSLVGGTALQDRRWSPTPRSTYLIDMKYQDFGFQFLQDAIDRAIIELQTNQTQRVGVYLQQFPSQCYRVDKFVKAIENTLPLMMILSWVCSAALIIKNIVYEKELRLKEFMKVMGLGNLVHWVAWFIQSFTFIFFSVLFFVLVIKFGNVIQHTNFGIVFLLVILFMIATIMQSFLISTFFSKANVAAACGAVIYFLCFIPYWILLRLADSMSYSQKMATCLLPQVAFGWGCAFIAGYEGIAVGVNWGNIGDRALEEESDVILSDVLIMLAVDCLVYGILTWYIEAVFPGQYGIPRPPYFFLTKSYWCGTACSQKVLQNLEEISAAEKQYSEAEPTQLPLGVAVRHLKKTFSNGKVALAGISLNFYESQITSFLGHNGAGKTTTLSILTGLFPPTEGTVLVYGNDVRTRIEEIRKSLGMCPQHNILFGSLTVRQQLVFYAGLKGVPTKQIDNQVKEMIEELALTAKADTPASDLSGGNQRRLAVAAAFIGGSKTVILDEPTAGVDPCARRLIWDLLLRKKEGRTIILSTHFMDEADVLGDRIAIIGAGKLRCCGSSMYLKKCFGSGYRLSMVRKTPSQTRLQLPSDEGGHDGSGPSSSGSKESLYMDEIKVEDTTQKVKTFVTQTLSSATLVEDVGHELTYNVPSENPKALQEFFVKLESNMKKLGISSYGISETRLEEIFLKAVGEEGGEGDKADICCPNLRRKVGRLRKGKKKDQTPIDDIKLMDSSDEESDTNAVDIDQKVKLIKKRSPIKIFFKQLWALLIKRFINFRRSIKGAFCEIVIPILLVAIVMYAVDFKVPKKTGQKGQVALVPWNYKEPRFVFQKMDYPGPDDWNFSTITNPTVLDEFARQDAYTYMESIIDPPGMGVACVANTSMPCTNDTSEVNIPAEPDPISNGSCKCDDRSIYECAPGAYQPPPPKIALNTTDILVNMSGRNVDEWIIMTDEQYRLHRFGGFTFGDPSTAASNSTIDWTDVDENLKSLENMFEQFATAMNINWTEYRAAWTSSDVYFNNTFQYEMNTTERIRAFFSGLDIRSNVKVWFNNQGWISGPSFASIFSNAVLRANLRNVSPELDPADYGILTINHPMNSTKSEQANEIAAPNSGIILFEACMLLLAFSIVPASYVLFVIEENISFSKHLQFVTGVRPITYWISNFVWDMTNFMIPLLLTLIVFAVFNQQAYIGDSRSRFATFMLIFLYGFAIIPLMYIFTFLFRIPSLAFVILTIGNSFVGWISTMTTLVLEDLGKADPDLGETNELLKQIFLVFPQFCLGRGLMDIVGNYYVNEGLKKLNGDDADLLDVLRWGKGKENEPSTGIGHKLFCLFMAGVVYFGIVLALEYRKELLWCFSRKKHFTGGSTDRSASEDEDVREERERINSKQGHESFALKIVNLTKIFDRGCCSRSKPLRAVDKLCVGVRAGECFGLLGVNGAGKTTTFSMLTGKLTVTSGDSFVNGSSILSKMDEVCHQIGYCPQFDAIHPLLSGREELRFYARLRGIKGSMLEKVVSNSIAQLGLKSHADRSAGTYSGGNKRKLSTAIALIGSPAVVLLDEPTTGMDPKARRFLWNRIAQILKDGKTSVVLTSHSMEECEALCHRIGIMVNGRFRCLGSAQHLKSRFGQGYTLTVKIGGTKPKTEEAVEFFKARFPGLELKEQHLSQLRFQLPSNVKALSEVFTCMAEAIPALHIEDYTLSQTTLEQVFVGFAQEQGAAEREKDAGGNTGSAVQL